MERKGSVVVPVDFVNKKRIRETSIAPSQERPVRADMVVPESPTIELFSTKLQKAREELLNGTEKSDGEVKSYDIAFDIGLYKVLQGEQGSVSYELARHHLDAYMRTQLETHLGERLHVGVSKLRHRIVDREMLVESTQESLLEMVKRGRDTRRKIGKPIDFEREDAEVVGFQRIQDKMTDPETKVGTMMFFVSPRGEKESSYQNNFYDVFIKLSEEEVVSYRYTSGLTKEESHERLKGLDVYYDRETTPSDAEFIAHPVTILPGRSLLKKPDDIHTHMHIAHTHMTKKDFDVVRNACRPLIEEYIESLRQNPENMTEHAKRLDILMNYADNAAKELADVSKEITIPIKELPEVRAWIPPSIDRDALSKQKVRVVATGCGSSGGSSGSSMYSVAEAADRSYTGENAKDDPNLCKCGAPNAPHFHCPTESGGCHEPIIVGKGIKKCPNNDCTMEALCA